MGNFVIKFRVGAHKCYHSEEKVFAYKWEDATVYNSIAYAAKVIRLKVEEGIWTYKTTSVVTLLREKRRKV